MSTRVYVGRLDSDVREVDLERFFDGCGKINSILIKRGYAFVEFSDPLDADDAVFVLKGKNLNGQRINLELARGIPRNGSRYAGPSRRPSNWVDKYGPILRTDHQLVVENLSSRVSWQDLKDFMRKSGAEVTYANAHTDRQHVGYVEFATREDMMKAYDKWDNTELQGRRIKLIINDNPQSRSRRSRSRSRSRSSSYERYRERRRRNGSRSYSRSRSASRRRSTSRSRSREEKSMSKSRQLREERSRSRSISRDRRDHSRSRSPAVRSRSRSIDLYESRSQSPENRE